MQEIQNLARNLGILKSCTGLLLVSDPSDSQIVGLIENEEELVDDIVEEEEIKTYTIAQITQLLETRPTPTELQPIFQSISMSNSEIHQPASRDVPQQVGSDLAAEVSQ